MLLKRPPVNNKAHFPWLLFTSQRADQLIELIIMRVLSTLPILVKGPKEMGEISGTTDYPEKRWTCDPDNLWHRLPGCVSQWVSVCMCVWCVCVFACFFLLLILWIRVLCFGGVSEWTSHAVGGTRAQIRNLQSYSFENLFFGKLWKDVLSGSEKYPQF